MTQTTFNDQPTNTQRLAMAITHLANGLTRDPNTVPGAIMALELVHEIVQPKPPAPERSIAFTRQTRLRPDGVWETRDGRKQPWAPVPSPAPARDPETRAVLDDMLTAVKAWNSRLPAPAPAPTCDAPHCGCATGEDCAANGAGDPVWDAWTLSRDHIIGLGNTLKFTDGEEVTQFWIPAATSYDDMLTGLNVLSDRLHGREQNAPPAPDLAARLDGLQASVDALADRLDGNVRDKKEILALRMALADTANALGGRADPGCSLGFLQEVPKEAELVVARLKEAADLATEGFADPRAASSREVRDAVTALQKALGVGQTGIVGRNTMAAIRRIQAGEG